MKNLLLSAATAVLLLASSAYAQDATVTNSPGADVATSNSTSGANATNSGVNTVGPIDTSVGPIDSSVRVGPVTTGPSSADSNSSSGAVANSNTSSQATGGEANLQATTTSSATTGASTATTGASTSSASQSADNTGNEQNITFNTTNPDKLKTVPQVYAPALTTTLSDTCMGSTSGGVSVMGFGGTLGTTWKDDSCTRRLNAREMANTLGDREAARALLCQDKDVAAAYAAVGQPCNYPAPPTPRQPYQALNTTPPAPPVTPPPPPVNDAAKAPAATMQPIPNPPEKGERG